MIIPQHVKNYTERVEKELKQRYKDTGEKAVKKSLKIVKAARRELQTIEEATLFEGDSQEIYLRVFKLLDTINNQCHCLIYPGLGRVNCKVEIDPDLVLSLNKALSELTGEQRKEAEEVIEFLMLDIIPNDERTPNDEVVDYRVFKLVKSARKIRGILKKYEDSNEAEAYDISCYSKRIKMVFVKSEITLEEKLKSLGYEDIWEYKHLVGDYVFDDIIKKWLRVGITCTYYVYIPEK